ncbi:MAG: AAA family ATPase [Gammaproteobacteria bacterium]
MQQKKTVFILIGPKGSGKSHVGTVLKKYFGIPFLNVDKLGLENIPKSKLLGEDLIKEGFHFEEDNIAKILQTEDSVAFEATGSHTYFFVVLNRLRSSYAVKLIRVSAPLDKCLERIATRDQTKNIPVSNELIQSINERALAVQLPWDLELDNSVDISEVAIVASFQSKFYL